MKAVGVGYRRELAHWIEQRPGEVECLEITAEHFYEGGQGTLRTLRSNYPLFVHGLGLSLGTPGPLEESNLEQFRGVVDAADPVWISEHVAFTRTEETDLGHLNPVWPSRQTLEVLVRHARQLSDRCGRPLILENITSDLRLHGELSEPEFLNRLCEQADCGLLLDVTNLFINSRNHGFDPIEWLHQISPERIVQLHVVGYGRQDDRWVDHHAAPIQQELFDLTAEVAAYAPVQAVIIEHDANFPTPAALAQELVRLREILDGH